MADDAVALHLTKSQPAVACAPLHGLPIQHLRSRERGASVCMCVCMCVRVRMCACVRACACVCVQESKTGAACVGALLGLHAEQAHAGLPALPTQWEPPPAITHSSDESSDYSNHTHRASGGHLQRPALAGVDLEVHHVLEALVVGGVQEHLRLQLPPCVREGACVHGCVRACA